MEFCPNCGFMLEEVVEGGKRVLKCPNCGFTKEASNASSGGLTFSGASDAGLRAVEESSPKGAITKLLEGCPRCGHTEAYSWVIQTRAADEPPTRIYKCTKCGYTWREYA